MAGKPTVSARFAGRARENGFEMVLEDAMQGRQEPRAVVHKLFILVLHDLDNVLLALMLMLLSSCAPVGVQHINRELRSSATRWLCVRVHARDRARANPRGGNEHGKRGPLHGRLAFEWERGGFSARSAQVTRVSHWAIREMHPPRNPMWEMHGAI